MKGKYFLMFNLYVLTCRVFGAIIFGAFSIGEAMSLAPDYSKSRVATKRVFRTIDAVPSIDSFSSEGEKRVCAISALGVIETRIYIFLT